MGAQCAVGQRPTGDDLRDGTASEENEDHGAGELGREFTQETCPRRGCRHVPTSRPTGPAPRDHVPAIVTGTAGSGIHGRAVRVGSDPAPEGGDVRAVWRTGDL
ncbi:hypothetical protein GCM10010344_62640 [Streptomyces bluensis]|nr:hypothetical protein GCM10010344_62640 [Streptomyces bluensis]